MLYVINKAIFFRDSDGTVWTEDENESTQISLTATTSRLLAYFLERQGVISTRDEILETVWLSHGLRSSNHSLNKYVADLRKMFTTLGVDIDVIITVPGVGFTLTQDVEVTIEERPRDVYNSSPLEHVETECNNHTNNVTNVSLSRQVGKWGYGMIFVGFLLLSLLPVFFSGSILNLIFAQKHDHPESQVYLLGEINGCQVMTLAQSSSEMTVEKLKIAENIIKAGNLTCYDNDVLFFQPSDPAIHGHAGRVFIAKCTKNKAGKENFSNCKSYYEKNFSYEN